MIKIKPQKGFQEKVDQCTADVAIIGGSAGGGKTFSLVIEPLKWVGDPNFGCVFLRKNLTDLKKQGSAIDESRKWYPHLGGVFNETSSFWRFPSGAKVSFGSIPHEKDLETWKSSQIQLIVFEELTEFNRKAFFFMLSRNRGVGKVRPYVRASCNPMPGNWVADIIDWYLDRDTGMPIPERDGVLRYFISYRDRLIWGNTKDEVIEKCPEAFENAAFIASKVSKYDIVKSFTFIRGSVEENQILLQNDPGYIGNLMAGDENDQARFLLGSWKISVDGKGLFIDDKIDEMFIDSYPDGFNRVGTHITCDAAKFGRNLCVILVWFNFTVIHTTVFYQCAPYDIFSEIEILRMQFSIPKVNCIVDQDGVGGDVVKLGKYKGFMSRATPVEDPDTRQKENYGIFKDQCFFRLADLLNDGELKYVVNKATCKIFDKGSRVARFSTILKLKDDSVDELVDIKYMIKKHLRSIRKGDSVIEIGGEIKICTNSKEEQKEILSGQSPDFADALMMRIFFSVQRRRKGKLAYFN